VGGEGTCEWSWTNGEERLRLVKPRGTSGGRLILWKSEVGVLIRREGGRARERDEAVGNVRLQA